MGTGPRNCHWRRRRIARAHGKVSTTQLRRSVDYRRIVPRFLFSDNPIEESNMFLLLAIILGIAWIGGFAMFHVTSAAIHILLVLAIVSVVVHFGRGKRATI
jgi:hypothetical protein